MDSRAGLADQPHPPTWRLRQVEAEGDRIVLQNMLALILVDGTDFIKRRGWDHLAQTCAAYFKDWGRGEDWALIAEDDKEKKALGALWMRRPASGGTPFIALACLPHSQGQGLGSKLIKASQGHALEMGHDLSLTVHVRNPAIRLYRRLDFREYASFDEPSTGPMIRMSWFLPYPNP